MRSFIISTLLLLAILLPALATAHDFEVDGIYYNINGNEATVTFGDNKLTGSVIIPAAVTYDGITYPVTAIDHLAFRYCTGLTSIDIPNSVKKIGDYAFDGCTRLTSIDIPNSVTSIGFNAFYNTAWYNKQPAGLVYAGMVAYHYKGTMPSGTSMTLKEGTLGIASAAFRYCTGMTSIVIPNSVIKIGDEAFWCCKGLTSIDIPNSVTEIGDDAFWDCTGLTNIDIPNSVTVIGSSAFNSCTGMTSIVIPNSVTAIGGWAFANCIGLTDVYCYIADLSRVSSGYGQFYLDDWDYSGRTLHVLQGMADAYRADENWYPHFGQIVEDLIPDTLYGDVNGDRAVNIADVNAVINIILGGNGDTAAADVNGDGAVNITDINAVINIILNGTQN